MNQEISKTTVIAVVGVVLVVLIGGGLWMWLRPAGVGSSNPPVGTPANATALRDRRQEMRDSFIAAHRRGPQGARGAEPSDQ